ncbi:MAG: quinol:cytochrome C oxidoreductase [Cyclobacteriaceae bacterium]
MSDERFEFTAGHKKNIGILGIVGLALFLFGVLALVFGGHGDAAAHGAEAAGHGAAAGGHGEFHWWQRVYANLWFNNVYFSGIAAVGVLFVAIQYAAQAGWSAGLIRVPLAFGNWLPYAFGLMIGVFVLANHDLFHWTHHSLYEEFLEDGVTPNPEYDEIIAGKSGYLNYFFYIARMIVFFAVWYFLFNQIKKEILKEDIEGGTDSWKRLVKLSAIFIVFWAVSSSMSAWDWILSIDTHWFSTMIGWYVFASWWVTGLAVITLMVIFLKQKGYLSVVNSNHLHDLGKFVFAFSIFWTYIWISQFLLIYYANIPEESVYFFERINSDNYAPIFYINLIVNFFFPFLALMTRDAKRHVIFLKIVCIGVIIGHWLDFYLMVTPGTLKENGGFGFIEIGIGLVYAAGFLFVVFSNLGRAPLVAKNHPMLEESLHHHI